MEGAEDYDIFNIDMNDELCFDDGNISSFPQLPAEPHHPPPPPEEEEEEEEEEVGEEGVAVVTPSSDPPLSQEEEEKEKEDESQQQQQEEEDPECPHFIEVHNLSDDDFVEDHLDSVLSDALNQLTIGEREKVFHDVHGVPSLDDEEFMKESCNPNFLNKKLSEFQDQLDKIIISSQQQQQQQQSSDHHSRLPTKAIRMAMEIDASSTSSSTSSNNNNNNNDGLFSNRKFRIAFLRTDDYNIKDAVARFIRFFDLKLDLFGPDKLCKNITYDDLGNDDVTYLSKGVIQVLPVPDRAGRPIIIFFPSQQEYSKVGSGWIKIYGRMYFYLWTSMMDGEALRKKGAVCIIYNVGPLILKEFDPGVPKFFFNAIRSLPFKIVGCHMCFNSNLFRPIAQNAILMSNSKSFPRASCKLHKGSQQEVFYSLMTYGIPTDCIPVNFENDIKKMNHQDMLAMVQKKEEYCSNQSDPNNVDNMELFVIIPDNLDILFGKGTTYHNRPGNMRLKLLIDDLLPHQSSLQSRAEKVKLVQQVVDTVKAGGGRFLSKESGFWMSVQDDAARKKVADLFRNRRKVVNKANAAAAAAAEAASSANNAADKTGSSSSSMMFVNGPGGGAPSSSADSNNRPSLFGFVGSPPVKRFKHANIARI